MNYTTCVPHVGLEEIVTCQDQKHVVIYRKGVYFKLNVFKKDSDDVQLSVPEYYAVLQQIVEISEETKEFCPAGVFTAQNRDYWAKI